MSNTEGNKYAPQLSVSSRLNHAEHVTDAIRPLAARPVTQAPHAIQPIELFGGQTIEITEAADHTALHELRKKFLTNTLKVERATTNRVAQRLEVLRWAGAIWAAMAHLVANDLSAA